MFWSHAKREYALITREYALITREYALITREYALITREYALITREYALITREYALKGYASETHSKKLHASNSKELTSKKELTQTWISKKRIKRELILKEELNMNLNLILKKN